MSNSDATIKCLLKRIIRMTIIGDISIPIAKPMRLLIGLKTGSVTEYKKRTIGLYGSGLTQLKRAEIIIIHI
jgi:hypothetical protein